MLTNGLIRGALMLSAGALFCWAVATAFEIRDSVHSSATAAATLKTSDFAAFNSLAPAKQGRARSLF